MHRLAFLEPGHFHAALTLRERHPGAADEVLVYAAPGSGAAGGGPEIDEFLALLDAFNRRAQHPTAWKPVVRVDADPLARLVADRRCDVVILAGRNDRKMALARRLHDAGLHVLADKPWITQAAALADVRHVLSGGARTMEMMTSRHAGTAVVAERLVRDPEIFGGFDPAAPWPIDLVSVHHLEKSVNGAPLRRPPWYFDVRAQGDGLADIPTHLIDQAQRLVAASPAPVELLSARRWSTAVPRALFARVTGTATFPPEIEHLVERDVLAYACNAEIAFRLGGVGVHLTTRWDLTEPPNGGDAHRATVTGTHARIRISRVRVRNSGER